MSALLRAVVREQGRAGVCVLIVAMAVVLPSSAGAQPDAPIDPYPSSAQAPGSDPDPGPVADEVDERVAQAVFERGLVLYRSDDLLNARMLFSEALERSPHGAVAVRAKEMLQHTNERLVRDNAAGMHGTQEGAGSDAASADGPMDPYGAAGVVRGATQEAPSTVARYALIATGASVGVLAGSALGGPTKDGDLAEGAALGGVFLGGAGAATAAWLTRGGRSPSIATADAIGSGALWGAYAIGLFGDAVTGVSSDGNDVYKFVAAGSVLGMAGGISYSMIESPSLDQVSLINSLGLYGTAAGWMLGVAMDPPESEAYSINAMVGAVAGLAAGGWLAREDPISRSQMLWIDLGAAAGLASSWVLLYPAIEDSDSSDDEQTAGLISVLTMGGGALVAWYLSRDGRGDSAESPDRSTTPAALLQRLGTGRWTTGVPGLRPVAGPGQGRSMTATVVGGEF